MSTEKAKLKEFIEFKQISCLFRFNIFVCFRACVRETKKESQKKNRLFIDRSVVS